VTEESLEMNKSSRQTQKESTRERIVQAAYEEFSSRGILATRMSDVALAAGVSHGTVFLHFKTQEELISEVIAEHGKRIASRTHELAEGSTTVREILAAHLVGILECEPFYTRLVIEIRMLPAESRNVWTSIQSVLSFHLSRVTKLDMMRGEIKNITVPFLFNAWTGLVHYYLTNGDLFAPEGNVIGRYGEEMLNQFMKLLSVRE
jgi:AcrR family transcriptional regulator